MPRNWRENKSRNKLENLLFRRQRRQAKRAEERRKGVEGISRIYRINGLMNSAANGAFSKNDSRSVRRGCQEIFAGSPEIS